MSIRRHTTYNLLGAVLPIGVSLVTVPIYLDLIGEARYGVLALAWLLLGYFGLFDLGLGRSVAQSLATLRDAPPGERATTFWTGLGVNLGLGLAGGALIWPAAHFLFAGAITIEPDLQVEINAAIPWLVLAVPLATLSSVLTGALQGRERFFELNVIAVVCAVMLQVLPLGVAIWQGANLGVLLPAALCARLVTAVALFACCRRHVYGGSRPSFDTARAGQLLRFGGWVTVTSLVGPMMVILDRFVIGALAGAKSVSHYTVPFDVAGRSTLISGSLVSALFPRLAASGAVEARQLAEESLRVLLVVMTPLTMLAVLLVKPFLALWIAPAFADKAGLTAQILLVGFWANALATIPYAKLQAEGRPDLVAKCHVGELLPYFALLYTGLTFFGLPGAAVAFALRVLLDLGLLTHFAGLFAYGLRAMAVPAALVLTAFMLALRFDDQPLALAAVAAMCPVLASIWAWRDAPARLLAALPGRSMLLALRRPQ